MSFYSLLSEGINYLSENGYDDVDAFDEWVSRIRIAARAKLPKNGDDLAKRSLIATFNRTVKSAPKRHPKVSAFTIKRIEPSLRDELDKRIRASAELIRLNREDAINTTLKRFSGWGTSVPPGGSQGVDKREVKANISKPLREQVLIERRVAIDQGHKLSSNVDAVIAEQAGAIAAKWRSHWRQSGYDYREDHKDRDKLVYAMRKSWASDLINKGAGYVDEMTMPAEEVYCRCYYVYLYSLRELPISMLTKKGLIALNGASDASS